MVMSDVLTANALGADFLSLVFRTIPDQKVAYHGGQNGGNECCFGRLW